MAVTVRIEPIAKDIEVLIGGLKGADASRLLAAFAADEIAEAKDTNASVLGRVPPFKIYVDGKQGAPLESVRPDGVIVVDFELVSDVLIWISQQLATFSPVKTGTYKRSHVLFADGVEVDPTAVVPAAEEYVFMNSVPYARKVERGSSSQAPNGVYEAVSVLARQRFKNLARITYGFRTAISGSLIGGGQGDRASNRNPAIIVRTNA
jgi:hypothetical protein